GWALDTGVGLPSAPDRYADTDRGLPGPPSTNRASAVDSLETYQRGDSTADSRTPVPQPAARRSAMAASRTASRPAPRCTHTVTSRAPTASAARSAPSSTRCGATRSSSLSLAAAGSLSAPFTITYAPPALAPLAATVASLRPVGNQAPPRPRSPAWVTVSTSNGAAPVGSGPYSYPCSASPAGAWLRSQGASSRGACPSRISEAVMPGPPRAWCEIFAEARYLRNAAAGCAPGACGASSWGGSCRPAHGDLAQAGQPVGGGGDHERHADQVDAEHPR